MSRSADDRLSDGKQMIDRLAPTRRPPRRPVNLQDWRGLLFLHWPVSPEVLRPLVPPSMDIDLFEDQAYVGVIPFLVKGLRAPGMPPHLGLRFLETNTRTYVHVNGRDPGVYFFSLDAASLLGVLGARLSLGLPYYYARMARARQGDRVDYAMRRRTGRHPGLVVRYEIGEPLGPAAPGTLEHFLIERYLLHVERLGTLWTVQVHHAPYPLRRARVLEVQDQLVAAAGLPEPTAPPPLVHYADGVDVEVFAPRVRL